MWNILKAELRYHQTAIQVTYALGAAFLIFAFFSGLLKRMNSPMATWSLTSVVTSAYIFLLMHIGSHDDVEKRERLHALLPIPRRELGITRTALWLLLLAGFSLIWLIGVMVAGQGLNLAYLYYMLSSNAFFIVIVALIAIFLDLGHFGKNTYRRRLAALLALLVLLLIGLSLAGKILPVLEFVFLPYTTPAGATVFVLMAAGLVYLDIVIYTRRKSYLN